MISFRPLLLWREGTSSTLTRGDHGLTREVTSEVQWALDGETVARLDGTQIFPVADGQATIQVSLGELTATAPITVSAATTVPDVSFRLDVMPIFMKSGCNTGNCHGAARGKDGFRLSLFGFDPEGDYFRLTREMVGRRIDLAIPESCLMINKTTGQVSHTGGEVIDPAGPDYATLVKWLKAGAPNDVGEVPSVVKLEVLPDAAVLNGADEAQQLTVRATYSDGTDRDVTNLAYFMSSNDNSVTIDQSGLMKAANRGESFVMARYETHTVGVPVITLPRDLEFKWTEVPENNYVDTFINNKLKKLRILPSEICTDRDFIRRTSLDICGVLPTTDEVNAFVADESTEKRAVLVDTLLERPEFSEIWVMKWAELLQVRSSQTVSYKATLLYYDWLQAQIAANVPINEMVINLLAASGGTFSSPATNYYENEQDLLKVTENVAQVFLGMRLQCTQCHNHPFDRWTMDDYYGFASFFSQIGRKPSGNDPRERIVFNSNSGDAKHPVTGQNMKPKFLGGETPETAGLDRRRVVAEWITSPENPYFSKNLANIVWAHFMGRGIVHEVDDVRVSNPASNQPLLDALGQNFADYGYDFKKLVRDICNSRTYQLATTPNETNESDESNFSHSSVRRIRAEVLLDVISQVTETRNKFRGLPLGARAVQIADGNTSSYFLTTFGRASRQTVCSCEVKMDPNLSQALHLINGDTVENKVAQGGAIKKLMDEGKSEIEIISDLYLRSLARTPTDEEAAALQAFISENPAVAAADAANMALMNAQSAADIANKALADAKIIADNANKALPVAQAALDAANNGMTVAQAAIDAPIQALAAAQTNADQANQALAMAQAAVDSATKVLTDTQAATDVTETAIAEAQTALDAANVALVPVKTAADTANTTLANAQAVIDAPAKTLTAAQVALETANKALVEAMAGVEAANKVLADAQAATDTPETVLAEAQAAVVAANSLLATAQAGIEAPTQALIAAQTAIDAPNTALVAARTAVESANKMLGEAQVAADQANASLAGAQPAADAANAALPVAKAAADAANKAMTDARSGAIHDIFWALLNSQEFIFNH